jgi:hypothetical protein
MQQGKGMSRRTTLAILAVTLLVLPVAGCSSWSQWQFIRERPGEKVVTKLLVRTVPPGGEISINGSYQGKAPIRIPVRYESSYRVYERREALPYPHVETREVPSYRGNVFRLDAYVIGRGKATQTVTANGEEELEVTIEYDR